MHNICTALIRAQMGHGASTNVKKLTINQAGQGINDRPPSGKKKNRARNSEEPARAGERPGESLPTNLGWTRSNSDGCIVENLNTSKTKAELLEQQVDEYKELFHHAEQKAETAEAQAKLLEQQMAEVEGANFDLLDRVSGLEQQIEEMKDQTSPEAEREYSETVDDQNQTIEKHEQQIRSLVEDLAKMRIKLKKRLRSAQTELAEARQEAGLKMYSLKDEIGKLQEENAKLVERLDRAHAVSGAQSRQNSAAAARNHIIVETPKEAAEDDEEEWEDGRTKVILELSSQLSAQDQRICELEEAIKEKDKMISALQRKGSARPPSGSRGKSESAGRRTVVESVDGENEASSSRRERQSSASSSKGRESHRSSSGSARERTGSSGKHRSIPDELTCNDDEGLSSSSQGTRTVRSAGSSSSGKVRQQSASSLDSAISDHSDSGSTKVSSAGSSRQRRRIRKQLSREVSTENTDSLAASSKHYSDVRVEGRDSGIGVANDKSKYSELDQMMEDIIGNS
ncbi:uncharacterized protein [Asterias amurensis]|uniref:uncharacterized protein n=1 Tax=Asterias amurensis TaxID=7602 RepID=UPI003AB84946